MQRKEDDVQISVPDAAVLLGVDRATVWRYITLEHDPLPAKKIGHGYVLWQSDVEAYKPKANRPRGPKPRHAPPAPSEEDRPAG
jgi:predicted DNA-binding transcriptional regulator AlpA